MHDDIGETDVIREFKRSLDLIQCGFTIPALGLQDRYPNALLRADILHERQVKRRRRQRIFLEPSPDRPQTASIVKVQMRTVAEELESVVSGFPHGFQQIHSN